MNNKSIVFSSDGIFTLGKALGSFLLSSAEDPTVILGRDTRPSGEEFSNYLKTVLSSFGVKVLDLGIAPTPTVAYITKKYSASLGIIITASHNPPKYNGIKLVDSAGLRLRENAEKSIAGYALKPLASSISSTYQPEDAEKLRDEYIDDQISYLGPGSLTGMRILIDCSNGAVAVTAKLILERLGAIVTAINDNVTKPNEINNHCGSEQVREKPKDFINTVKDANAEYGFAFDGDGDRVVIVDRYGNYYNGDDILFVLASFYLSLNQLPKKTIVTTNSANTALEEQLRKKDIRTYKVKAGDKNLEDAIWNQELRLGGEQVGNIIINDTHHGAADSLYATALLCKIFSSYRTDFYQMTKDFSKYPQVLVSIPNDKKHTQQSIEDLLTKTIKRELGVSEIHYSHWNSTTEPGIINIMLEGIGNVTLGTVNKIASEIIGQTILPSSKPYRFIDTSSRKRL